MPVQYNNNLAAWAKKLVGSSSLRQIEIKTGVTYSTTKNILDGRVPEATILIRFAAAFGEDIPNILRLAGYDDIADLWEQGQVRPPNYQSSSEAKGELTYEPDEENVPTIQALYEGLDGDDQDELVQIALMKWKRKRQQETTHGARPGTKTHE